MSEADLRRRVEEASLNGWPALRQVLLDGWVLRFSEGHTRRSNSVTPLTTGRHDLAEKIAQCEVLYARRGLSPLFRVTGLAEPGLDAALDAQGYAPAEDPSCVLFMDFARHTPSTCDAALAEGQPCADWLAAHARATGSDAAAQGAQRNILQALALPAVFAAARGADGGFGSLAFGAVHDGIVCVNLVVTHPAQRRQGMARRAVSAVLSWARESAGAEGACLAVVAANMPAIALYRGLGFETELYRYHYRRKTAPM